MTELFEDDFQKFLRESLKPIKREYKKRTEAEKEQMRIDNAWKVEYKRAFFDWQLKEKGQRHIDNFGYIQLVEYPDVTTHRGLEKAGENYIKWIGGAATNTPTVGSPRFEYVLVGGKMQPIIKGRNYAKGGSGKADTDMVYLSVNVKIDWKVKGDKQKENQERYQKRIEAAGGNYRLVRNMEELYKIKELIEQGELK